MGRRWADCVGLDSYDPRRSLRGRRFLLDRLLHPSPRQLATKKFSHKRHRNRKGFCFVLGLLCFVLGWLLCLFVANVFACASLRLTFCASLRLCYLSPLNTRPRSSVD